MNDDNDVDDLWSAGDEDSGADDTWAPLGGQSSIDDMARTLSTFGMRIDALVTSTTSYRAAITDRLVEYADTVNKLVKNQSSDLEEHRAANQRLLTELQRGIATSDDSVARLGERIDELLTVDSADDSSRQVLVEVRSVLDAQERLGQFLTEALDQFGDRVTERLDAGQNGAVDQLDSLASTLAAVHRSDQAIETTLDDTLAELRGLRDTLVDLASGDVVAALWDEVRALRETIATLGPGQPGPSAAPSGDVAALTDAVSRLLDAAEVVPPEETDRVREVADDLAQLRADLSEGLVIEPDAALTSVLDDVRSHLAKLDVSTRDDLGATLARVEDRVKAVAADDGVERLDNRLSEVVAALVEMRDSLVGGVEARPTAELTDALAGIRSGIEALGTRLDDLAAETDQVRWPGGDSGSSDGDDLDARFRPDEPSELERLATEIAAARADVSAIGSRLDEGLEIDVADGQLDLVDRFAALRDDVTAELEAVRQVLADAVERPAPAELTEFAAGDQARSDEIEMVVDLDPVVALIDELRDEIRSIPSSVASAAASPSAADELARLRDEIREMVEAPESFAEAVRTELVALRRRIKVRSEADVLTDDQLDRIAEAVAERLR